MTPVKYYAALIGGGTTIGILATCCLYCAYKILIENNPQPINTNLLCRCGLFTVGAGIVIAGTLTVSFSTLSNSMH